MIKQVRLYICGVYYLYQTQESNLTDGIIKQIDNIPHKTWYVREIKLSSEYAEVTVKDGKDILTFYLSQQCVLISTLEEESSDEEKEEK